MSNRYDCYADLKIAPIHVIPDPRTEAFWMGARSAITTSILDRLFNMLWKVVKLVTEESKLDY